MYLRIFLQDREITPKWEGFEISYPPAPGRLRYLKALIIIGLLASTLHFADNALEISRYPEPASLTPWTVFIAWCLLSPLAVVALVRPRADWLFILTAGAYSLALLSGLLHYAYGSPWQMALLSNVTVLSEAAAGFTLAIALGWNGLRPEPTP